MPKYINTTTNWDCPNCNKAVKGYEYHVCGLPEGVTAKTVLGDICDLYWCNKCGGWSEIYYDHRCVDCGESATYIKFGECKSDIKAIPHLDYTPLLERIADALERIALSIELLELFENLNKEDDNA